MLRIAPNGYQSKQYSQNPSFKSRNITMAELRKSLQPPVNIEKRVEKLISKTGDMINESRRNLRQKGLYMVEPRFSLQSAKDGRITLRPIPNSRTNGFMLELDKQASAERIFVDKELTDKIIYERSKKTAYGSAVTGKYDVKNGENEELTQEIYEKLNKYLSYFLRENEMSKKALYIK